MGMDRGISEMTFRTKGNKVIGAIFVLFGSIVIYQLFALENIVNEKQTSFILKYFNMVFSLYVGFGLIIAGVLFFKGFFVLSYHAANSFDKAKHAIFWSSCSVPFFLLMLVAILSMIERDQSSTFLILSAIFFTVMIVYFLWLFVSSLNTLKNDSRRGQNRKR